ncbi:MAG TPA: hypothetical protein ENN05_01985 [Deltaproteobacteria bacterium]|nr:hypothetical protein [Deltaproteobacteria bacterium]
MKKVLIVVLFVCIGMSGCTKSDDTSSANDATQKEMVKNVSTDKDMVARVGDDVMTKADLQQILSQIPLQYRSRYSSVQGLKDLVDRLVGMKMLAWEARKQGLDKRPDIKVKLDNMIEQILAHEIEQEIRETIKVDEKDIEGYYKDNQDTYSSPAKIKAFHILVDTKDEAESILKEIRGGADFKELARQRSKCPSAAKSGDLGWFERGKMDPSFEKAAFDLNKGEISDVVKSTFGYHLIKVDNIRPARTKTLDQARKTIEKTMEKALFEKQIADLKSRIRNDVAVSVNEEFFNAFANEADTTMKKEEPITNKGE